MNKKHKSESGITLVALFVTIIIIVILLNVAQTTAEDYKITAKKEMLDQAIRSEMIAQATLR